MNSFLYLFFILAYTSGAVWAGEIVGRVGAQGKKGAEDVLHNHKYGSRKFKFMERVNYRKMKDFVVYIDQYVPSSIESTSSVSRVVAHSNGQFIPHVLPVMVGGKIEWPNKDDIHHNAFSFSEAKAFDLGLYKNEVKSVVFDKPGRVDIFCSIHTSMHCIVLVLENPFFSTTDRRGRYRIRDIPAGKYRLRAWHERLPSQVKVVEVPEVGTVQIDFTLSVNDLPQY